LFVKPEGKRLERARHTWDNNIKMHLKETKFEDVVRIDLAPDRNQWRTFVNMVK
jgi:hypothetical protein